MRRLFCSLLMAAGIAAGQDAISALRADYAGPKALCRVKVNGLRAGTDLMGHPVEVRVANGAVMHGSFLSVRSGRDVPIALGQLVRVTDISPESNTKFDALRVRVVADGATIPIAFVLPAGGLNALSEAHGQELIGQVLEPVQGQAPRETTPASASAAAPIPAAPTQARQSAAQPQRTALPVANIEELNTILKRHDGDAILVAGGVRAAMITPDYTPDNLVINGVLQLRGQGMYHGMRDVALWQKTQVQFIEMRAFSDDQHDLMRLVLRAPIGAFAPITWVLPKGQLTSMSKKQIMLMMDPIIAFAAADEHTFANEREKPNQATVPTKAMHAPRPPQPGCEWVTYESNKYRFELLREHCQKNGPLQDRFNFDVLRKPAGQAIEAAIRQQVIAHFNDPQAHSNCRVVQDAGEEAPGWSQYSIKAFGPYAHPKVAQGEAMEKGDGFCDGWDGGDTTSLVLYNPTITKELFFAYHGLSDPINDLPDNIFSLRMLSSSPNRGSDANPVSKLSVRGTSIRMSREQVLEAGQAAGMRVLIDSPVQLKLADPTASAQSVTIFDAKAFLKAAPRKRVQM